MTQKKIENIDIPIFVKEMKFIIQNLPTKRHPGQMPLQEFYQIFKEEIIKSYPDSLRNLGYETSINVI